MSGYIDENARIANNIHDAYEEGYADGKRDAVVRCKDCIHRRKGGFSRSETDGWTVNFTTPCDLGDEGFCSKGEKVTE